MKTPNNFTTPLNGKKIALFRALKLGDSLCAIPAVRALKTAWPTTSITLIGLPWQESFAKRFSSYFDDFIPFSGWPGLPEKPFVPAEVVQFLQQVQHRQFDWVIQMQGKGSATNPICMLFGAKQVAGLCEAGAYCPDPAHFPPFREGENEILRLQRLIREALHIPTKDSSLEFPVYPVEQQRFQQICKSLALKPGSYVCLHPGASDARRRWAVEKFAYVGDQVAKAGYRVLITGDTEEAALTRAVKRHMHAPAIDLVEHCGHVGLGEVALIIEKAVALLTNDTGISHIATAMKTPSVVLFSSFSDPRRWAPLDGNRHIRIQNMHMVHPHSVLEIFSNLLPVKPTPVDHESIRSYTYL